MGRSRRFPPTPLRSGAIRPCQSFPCGCVEWFPLSGGVGFGHPRTTSSSGRGNVNQRKSTIQGRETKSRQPIQPILEPSLNVSSNFRSQNLQTNPNIWVRTGSLREILSITLREIYGRRRSGGQSTGSGDANRHRQFRQHYQTRPQIFAHKIFKATGY